MKPADEDISYNIQEHIRLIELAAENRADLIVFPEMSLTGYVRETARNLCFTEDDARLDALGDLAAKKNMIIIAGAPVVIDSRLYIGSFIMFPDRSIRIYTKQFLHSGEEGFFSSSFDYDPVIELNGERICLAICADIDNPLHAKNAGEKHCTVYIASILFRNAAEAHGVLQGYAKKHSMSVLMSNYCGVTYGMEAGGRSAMWSADGTIIAELDKSDTGLVIGRKRDGIWYGYTVKA